MLTTFRNKLAKRLSLKRCLRKESENVQRKIKKKILRISHPIRDKTNIRMGGELIL